MIRIYAATIAAFGCDAPGTASASCFRPLGIQLVAIRTRGFLTRIAEIELRVSMLRLDNLGSLAELARLTSIDQYP